MLSSLRDHASVQEKCANKNWNQLEKNNPNVKTLEQLHTLLQRLSTDIPGSVSIPFKRWNHFILGNRLEIQRCFIQSTIPKEVRSNDQSMFPSLPYFFVMIYLNNLSFLAYKSLEKRRKPKTKISENQFRFSLHKTETPCQPKKSTVVEVKKPNMNRKKNFNWDLCVQRFSTVFQQNDTLGNIRDELLFHHNRTILRERKT